MSGQSWSRREAPWGSRISYAGGRLGDISLAGPGMTVVAKSAPRRVTAAEMEPEKAALLGLTVDEYRAQAKGTTSYNGPRSTKDAQGPSDGDGSAPRKRHKRQDPAQWFYIDNAGAEQGPFERNDMIAWCQAGQLEPETKAKKGKDAKLRTINHYDELSGTSRKQRSEDDAPGIKLYVGNLQVDATEEELRALFDSHGSVVDVFLPTDAQSGKGRSFGFVKFGTAEEATAAAAATNGMKYKGRTLRVNAARKPGAPGVGAPGAGILGKAFKGNRGDGALYGGDAEAAGDRSWVAQVDNFSGKTYYWNVLTDERSWSRPDGMSEPSAAPSTSSSSGSAIDGLSALSGYASSGSDDD